MPAEYSCDEKRRRMSSAGPSKCSIKTKQPGVAPSLLHSGSTFRGQQRSQGSCYQVDVVLQVKFYVCILCLHFMSAFYVCILCLYIYIIHDLFTDIAGNPSMPGLQI